MSSLFLDERRTPDLIAIIDKNYAIEQDAAWRNNSYVYLGRDDYRLTTTNDGQTLRQRPSDQVNWLLDNTDRDTVKVLDIGAAACVPLCRLRQRFGSRVSLVGVSAIPLERLSVFERRRIAKHSVDLRIGNADYWGNLIEPDAEFDLIMSHYGLSWFSDPLSALERALSQLTTGGRCWVNPFRIALKREASLSVFFQSFHRSGFVPVSEWQFGLSRGVLKLDLSNLFVEKVSEGKAPVFSEFDYSGPIDVPISLSGQTRFGMRSHLVYDTVD